MIAFLANRNILSVPRKLAGRFSSPLCTRIDVTLLGVFFLHHSQLIIFSLSARCIDPARDRSRVINSLYLSLVTWHYVTLRPLLPSLLFFLLLTLPIPFSSFLFFLVQHARRIRQTLRIDRGPSRFSTVTSVLPDSVLPNFSKKKYCV